MTAESTLALLFVATVAVGAPGCVGPREATRQLRASGTSGVDVELRSLGPSELDFERDFADRLIAVASSPACHEAPPHAVVEAASSRARYLGFCDGRVIQHPASGGLIISSTREELPAARLAGWESRHFSVAGVAVVTDVPTRAEVRIRASRGDGVRLVGKQFDLHLHAIDAEGDASALASPPGCSVVESGPRHLICRRAGGHRLVATARVGSGFVRIESDPRLRATRRQAQEMLVAVQMMHRVGRSR